jgi:hypothetical protein
MLSSLAERIKNGVQNQKGLFDSVVGQIKTQEKRWIIDIDNVSMDGFNHDPYQVSMREYINELQKEAGKEQGMTFVRTRSGFHIITQPFNVMKFNQGPTIVIEDINAPPYNGRTRYAYFNSNQPDVIHIDLKTVTNFENTTNYKQNQAYTLFLVATILHETVHYGNNLNNFNEGRYDFGDGFEIDAYGSIIELKEF